MPRRTAKRHAQDVTVRISGVQSMPAVLESLGADSARILAAEKVDPALFDDTENAISLAAVGRLVHRSVEVTGCQHFGLLVGQQGGLRSFGLVGAFARYSPDLQTALGRLETYQHLYHGGQILSLEASRDVATLSYAIVQPGIRAVDQIEDGALAIFCNVMRNLCGSNWLPLEVRFAHRRPSNTRPFVQAFQTSLQFDAEQSGLVFSANWLRRRLPEADADLQRLLVQQIESLEASQGDEFPTQVRRVLRSGLLAGHASAEQVAALFSMHRRTLTRRLSAHGTSFSDLAEEGRFEIAQRMLGSTDLDITGIAAALDYADASAFTRAFRRWSGTTPAAWRTRRRRRR